MRVSPLDYRYGTQEMKKIFCAESRTNCLLKCEGALAKAHEKIGNIPPKMGEMIDAECSTKYVSMERIDEIEKQTKHDIMALTLALSEAVGEPASRYIHLGATSSDILDSATALQFKEANTHLEREIQNILMALENLSIRSRKMVCVGRTHGQHAVPTTFGFKVGVWVMEFRRHQKRLRELRPRLEVGKMSGAVGTGAGYGKKAMELESTAMEILGLGLEEISSQVVQRDRYVEMVCFFANVATSIEKVATEIRNLQRNEIAEVRESFDRKKQVGSSTMAQKMNPITCENICGLARIVRANVIPTMECAVMWHERDLANSSAERFIIPQVYVLLDDILRKSTRVLSNLELYPESMKSKIIENGSYSMSEAIIMAMAEKGVARHEAHEMIRQITIQGQEQNQTLEESLLQNPDILNMFGREEISHLLLPENYLGFALSKLDKYIGE